MSVPAVVHLKDLDNVAEKFGVAPDLEVRAGRGALGLENCGVSYERLAPNFRIPFAHRHNREEEVYVVVRGSARAKIEDAVVELKEWDAVRVAPQHVRQLEGGPEGAEIVVVGAPWVGPEDAEPVPNWWTD